MDFLSPVHKIIMGITPGRGFHAALRDILGVMAEDGLCIRPHILIYDSEVRNFRLFLPESAQRSAQKIDAPGAGITGQVFSSGTSVIVDRILDNPVFMCKFFARTREEMAQLSFISVPILSADNLCLGALSMDTPLAPHDTLQNRCRFLETVASIIAMLSAYADREAQHRQNASAAYEGFSLEHTFVASSKAMQMALETAAKAGLANSPVLISGEPGTGKALLALTIHSAGPRRDLTLRTFSCKTTPEAADRQLFGYKKGAFADASSTSKGLLELCRSSTLLLTNIECLPPAIQDKLALALSEQQFTRIGDVLPMEMDVRLISTTTADLAALADQGRFSKNLLAAISTFHITIPSLRERKDDIIPLALELLKQLTNAKGTLVEYISAQAQNALISHDWPGNVRELQHVLETGVKTCTANILQLDNLPLPLQASQDGLETTESFSDSVERFEKGLLISALTKANGNMLQAARDLQTSYRIINYKIKKYNIDPRSFTARH